MYLKPLFWYNFYLFFRTFRIMDDDRSNSLNFNEFKKGIHDYGCDMTKEEVQEMFTSIDRDGSGTLDFEEFLQALRVSL